MKKNKSVSVIHSNSISQNSFVSFIFQLKMFINIFKNTNRKYELSQFKSENEYLRMLAKKIELEDDDKDIDLSFLEIEKQLREHKN